MLVQESLPYEVIWRLEPFCWASGIPRPRDGTQRPRSLASRLQSAVCVREMCGRYAVLPFTCHIAY